MDAYGSELRIMRSGSEIVTDRYGMTTGSVTFQIPANAWNLLPLLYSPHPLASFILMERRSIKANAGIWLVTCDYAGAEMESEPVYELSRSVTKEPIETNDRFVSHIGGTPSATKNGAIFVDGSGNITDDNDVGKFDRFKISNASGTKNPLAGLNAYYAPSNTIWTKSWSDNVRPTDDTKIGYIDTPEGGPPDYGDGYNWLYMGLSYIERGRSYDIKKKWRLSGRTGWLEVVYPKSS